MFFLRLPVVRPGYSLQKFFFDGIKKQEINCLPCFLNPFKELITTMTAAFTGRLQFTGKKPCFTCRKGWLEPFTIAAGKQIALLRSINKLLMKMQHINEERLKSL